MNIHRIIFPEDDSGHWFESLEKFISEMEPEWLSDLEGVSSQKIDEIKKYYGLDEGSGKNFPTDYEIYLRHWGGSSYVYFPYKPQVISYFSVDNVLRSSRASDQSSDSFYLMIGTQGIDEAHLSFLFPPSGDAELVLVRYCQEDTKVAESLRQYLCCQAFLAFGRRQFPYRLAYELGFHMHEPPFSPSPEAEAWKKENSFHSELSDEELEDVGFNIQVEKLQNILMRHGYQQTWFSTPLDQVWLRSDSFCSISRDFDPNDMFDTVIGQICAYDLTEIQNVVKDFAQIGYQCVKDKKFRDY